MEFFRQYGKEIVSLFVPFLTLLLNSFFRTRARLVQAIPHTFTFLVQQPLQDAQGKILSPTQTANTRSNLIGNAGRETATQVELVFNWKPECINVWPPRHFEERVEADKRYTVTFSSLAPNEYVAFELLAVNKALPELLLVRSDQCMAETINMVPQQVLPRWQTRTALILLFFGLALVVYSTIVLLQFLILSTPFGH